MLNVLYPDVARYKLKLKNILKNYIPYLIFHFCKNQQINR